MSDDLTGKLNLANMVRKVPKLRMDDFSTRRHKYDDGWQSTYDQHWVIANPDVRSPIKGVFLSCHGQIEGQPFVGPRIIALGDDVNLQSYLDEKGLDDPVNSRWDVTWSKLYMLPNELDDNMGSAHPECRSDIRKKLWNSVKTLNIDINKYQLLAMDILDLASSGNLKSQLKDLNQSLSMRASPKFSYTGALTDMVTLESFDSCMLRDLFPKLFGAAVFSAEPEIDYAMTYMIQKIICDHYPELELPDPDHGKGRYGLSDLEDGPPQG